MFSTNGIQRGSRLHTPKKCFKRKGGLSLKYDSSWEFIMLNFWDVVKLGWDDS